MGDSIGMDIRLPMGLMFAIIGAIIAIYGVATSGDAMYQDHSLGINVNLWWGLILLAFGVTMLLLSRTRKGIAPSS
jgi:hypothetical protein